MTRATTNHGRLATSLVACGVTTIVAILLAAPASSPASEPDAGQPPADRLSCAEKKGICYDSASKGQEACYSGMFDFARHGCAVLRRDRNGQHLNPRKYECDRQEMDGGPTRVCHGEAIDACLDDDTREMRLVRDNSALKGIAPGCSHVAAVIATGCISEYRDCLAGIAQPKASEK